MAFFRKKPVVIEAWQFTNSPADLDTPQWLDDALKAWPGPGGARWNRPEPALHIETLEGLVLAMPGDWIIRGVKGELYPCKSDIFEATYEPVPEPEGATDAR